MENQKFYQQTWFMVLMLFLFAPVGIFLIWKYNKFNTISRVILSVVFALAFIGAITPEANTPKDNTQDTVASNTTEPTPEPKEEPTEEPTPEPKEEPTEEPTPEPKAEPTEEPVPELTESELNEKLITDTVNDIFGEENNISINYTHENNFVLIKAKGSENLTNKLVVKGMFLDIEKCLKQLKDLKNIDIDFNIVYSMVDAKGNISDDIVIKATYTWLNRSEINFDNFITDNIPVVADEWWMHPALEEALK